MEAVGSQFWHLRNHELFSKLNTEEIQDLCIISSFTQASKGDYIYFGNEQINRLYILKKGRIKIACYDDKDQEIVTEILKEGDIFGEVTLNPSENKSHEFAQAMTEEVSICSFSLENFESLLNQKPDLAIQFSKMVGEKLKIINQKYSDLIFKDARTRVINFFRLHARYEGKQTGNQVEIDMFLTHQDIASFTATSRQTVTTVINQLEAEGILLFQGRKKVVIPDVTRLG